MSKRTRYQVAFERKTQDWRMKRTSAPKGLMFVAADKADCVKNAAEECKRRLKEIGELSELVIKNKDNVIQDTRTYGRDPRRSKG